MMKNIVKISFLVIFNIAIIGSVNKAEAFPLPTLDISRIKTAVQNTMHAVQEIKQEIESNLRIIQEIQNGGYMAAAGDLFGKIQNGDYDRFGQNFKTIQFSVQDASDEFSRAKNQNDAMKKKQEAGLDRATAREEARKEAALNYEKKMEERMQAEHDKAFRKAVERRMKELMKEDANLTADAARRKAEEQYKDFTTEQLLIENQQKSKFNSAYTWLKDSRPVTDWGQAAIDAAGNDDWGAALAAAGNSVGAGFGNAGDTNFGDFIAAGSNVVGGVVDATQADSTNDAFGALMNNYGGIIDNAAGMGSAYQNYNEENAMANDPNKKD